MPSGTLYIVATPIGNLEDITLRALRVLKEADIIAAEDTRHSRKLLNRYDITAQLTSYHDHNKEEKAPVLIAALLEGRSVALVSDAGTPGISDPGYLLISLAAHQGVPVVPVPGASAAIAALSVSGLPTDRFVFEGFLPAKRSARMKRLEELREEERTLVFYEAPHRVLAAIEDMLAVLGDRPAALTRELTKVHEEVVRAPLSSVRARLAAGTVKGEFTIAVHGAQDRGPQQQIDPEDYLRNLILHRGLSRKEAVAVAARELGLPKKEIYSASLRIRRPDG